MSAVATRYHEADGVIAIERVQDCVPVAEHAAALRERAALGSPDMRLAATLPFVVIEMYCNDRGISFDEFVQNPEHGRAVLNDPALQAFRVWQGRA